MSCSKLEEKAVSIEVKDDKNNKIPEPTTELSKTIKAIGKDTVHKICSGQVVLNLAIVVKELVENSIDAGSTLIEVKLKSQGLESVEVSDNGCGVEESNLEAMTAKYHTSKIKEFSDLQAIETFGFRGEALSSLCALSDMTVISRHKSSQVGIRIELDHNGKIIKKTQSARQIGTTVILTNLFSTLPVRKRDFTKNIKREFTRMSEILQSYCLITTGVRIIVTNYSSKGAKTVLLSTCGSMNVTDNIVSIFGSNQMSSLLRIEPPPEKLLSCDTLDDLPIKDDIDLSHLKFDGWISRCGHGDGRGSKSRQFYFVNARPCDPKNIIKVVNEIYHRYNSHQYPFVFLNIILERSNVDVNLTPDKRQLLLSDEKCLLIAIKNSLLRTFSNVPSTFKLQTCLAPSLFKNEINQEHCVRDNDTKPDRQKFIEVLSKWKRTGYTTDELVVTTNKRKTSNEIEQRNIKMRKIVDYLSNQSTSKIEHDYIYNSEETHTNFEEERLYEKIATEEECKEEVTPEIHCPKSPITRKRDQLKYTICKTTPPNAQSLDSPSNKLIFENVDHTKGTCSVILDYCDDITNTTHFQKSETISTSVDEILNLSLFEDRCNKDRRQTRHQLNRLKFKGDINPSGNKMAEEELQREISKDMFSKMEIIGQFNLGFIIVLLDADLFIVDQHATDEKYNFEILQKEEVLQRQTLTLPQPLKMTAISEMVLIDNMSIFEKNGFKFDVNEEGPPTNKLKLLAKPFSKNWEFGKDDIDELIFMLQDAPEATICRPSRVRAMFASRACRKSVMIGTALNKFTMRKLIQHMGEIEQPWNCPHGRPTMRHLINLSMLAVTGD